MAAHEWHSRSRAAAFSLLLLLAVAWPCLAQVQLIPSSASTLVSTGLTTPAALAVDGAGDVFLADSGAGEVFEVPISGANAGKLIALVTGLTSPQGLALDGHGNLYIANSGADQILEVSRATIQAGSSITASHATLAAGAAQGTPCSVATNPDSGGNDGTASSATFCQPEGLAVGSNGLVYIADTGDGAVRTLDPSAATVATFAGSFISGIGYSSGTESSGSAPTSSTLTHPTSVAVDAAGNVFIADSGNKDIAVVNPGSSSDTVDGLSIAANTLVTFNTQTGHTASFSDPVGIAVDGRDNIFVADSGNQQVYELNSQAITLASSTTAQAVASDAGGQVYFAQTGTAAVKKLAIPAAFGATPLGTPVQQTLKFEVVTATTLDAISVPPGFSDSLSGSGCSLGAALPQLTVCTLTVTFNPSLPGNRSGALTFQEHDGNSSSFALTGVGQGPLVAFTPGTIHSLVTGLNSTQGNTASVATDTAGDLFVLDADVVREFKAGAYSASSPAAAADADIIAGGACASNHTGCQVTDANFTGDGGPAYEATLSDPAAIRLDAAGNLYIADENNNRIRAVNMQSYAITLYGVRIAPGDIATVVGSGGTGNNGGSSGDNGPANQAQLNSPRDLVLDSAGNLYIADTGNHEIRKVDPDGLITACAGSTTNTTEADGPLASTGFNAPAALALENGGDLYVGDVNAGAVYQINLSAATLRTVVAPTTVASFNGIATDAAGDLYLADKTDSEIFRVDVANFSTSPAHALIVAGSSQSGFSGDGGSTASSKLQTPQNVWLDGNANLYIADQGNGRIRQVTVNPPAVSFGAEVWPSSSARTPITAVNAGDNDANKDYDLKFAALGTPSETSFSIFSDACSNASLDAGSDCAVNLQFTPDANSAAIAGTLQFTDNSGSAGSTQTSQTASLSGSGSGVPDAISLAPTSASLSIGAALSTAVTATVTSQGSPVNGAIVRFAAPATGASGNFSGNVNATANTDSSGQAALPAFTANGTVGSYSVTATVTGASSNTLATIAATVSSTLAMTNNKAALTVTAANASMTYGGSLPTVAATVTSGALVAPDTLAGIGITCAASTSTKTTACSGSPANYTVTFVAGSLTVNPAAITVTAANASMTYGGSLPTVAATVTSGALVAPDTLASIGITCAASPSTKTTACSGSPANYTVTFVPGSLTVNPAALTVTAANASMTYGGSLPTVAGTVTSGALVAPDTLAGIGITCAASISTKTTACSGSPANYTVTFVAGSLTVNPAPLTLTVANATRAYGAANPPFSGALSGFVNSDTAAVVSGAAAFSTTATNVSAPGTYPITAAQGTLAAANYTFSAFIPGTLTVTQAAQTITFPPIPNQTFGTGPLTLTATATSGLPVTFTVVSGPATVSGSLLTLIGAGTVVIQASQPGNTNYAAAAPIQQSFGVAAGVSLGASVTSLTFGSQPVQTTSAAENVILTNTGATVLQISTVSTTGDFAAAANCPSVPAGGTCTVSVTFTPTATGTRTGTLSIASNAPSSPLSVALLGTGTAPGVLVSPAALIFGGQVVNTSSAAQTVSVLNTGSSDLHVANIAVTGDFAVSGNCSTVAPLSDCSFSVLFTPTAAGTRTGTITVTDDAGSGSQAVTLSGTGTAAGVVLAPPNLSFPDTVVGAVSAAQTATLTNTGTASLTSLSLIVQGDFTQTSTCGTALSAGQSCTISIRFKPTVTGAESGAVLVSDNLGIQPLALSGLGTSPAVSLSPGQLLFGSQPLGSTSNAQTVVVSNPGTGPLAIGTITAPQGYTFTTDCGATLAAGAACTVNILFAPLTTGPANGTVTIPTGAGDQTVAVQGVGVAPGLALAPSFAIFGAQIDGTSSPAQTLTATNTGATPLTLNPIQISGDFTETGQCPATLVAGASCLISVTFAPSALGNRSGSLTLSDATGAATAVAPLSGQGTQAGITIAPSTLMFGGVPVGVSDPSHYAQTVTVTNVGSSPLTLASISASGDFANASNCLDGPIAPGASCVISVTLTPTTIGTRTGTLQIVDPATGAHTVALSGLGQAPAILIYPTYLNFGSLPQPPAGSPVTLAGTVLSVTLQDVGNLPVTLNGFALTGDFNQAGNCPQILQPGAHCTLSVRFAPTALGNRTGTLTVSDNADGGSQTVALQGFGAPGGLTLTPPVLNFGTQVVGVTSQPQAATLTNSTGESLSNLLITPSGEYGETNDCGASLANGASCNLQITVTPVTVGDITGNVLVSGTTRQLGRAPSASGRALPGSEFRHSERKRASRIGVASHLGAGASAGGSRVQRLLSVRPQQSGATSFSLGVVAMTATAIPPGISFSLPKLSFSITAVGTTATGQTFTVTNTGNKLSLTHFTIAGTNTTEFPFTTNCPATLAPQASCTVTVTFAPDGAGERTGFMTFTADGGIFAQMPISGVGIGPELTAAPSTLVFAPRMVATTSAPQTILLQNTGGLPLLLTAVTPGGDYSVTSSTCSLPQTLAVNATCTVSVAFTPSATGTRNGALTLTSNSVDGPALVALNGSSNTVGLSISSLKLAFGTEGVGVPSAVQTFTLTNNNASAYSLQSLTISPSSDYAATNNCPAALAAGAGCTVSVTFDPTAIGERDAAVNIASAAGLQQVGLTGAGSDFAITWAGTRPSATTTFSGGLTTYHLGLTSQSTQPQTVALSCSTGLGFSCSLSASTLQISAAQPATFDLLLKANRFAALPPPSTPSGRTLWLLLFGALTCLLAAVASKRRRLGLGLAGAAMLLIFTAGCGTPRVGSGVYHVTVQAKSSTGESHARTLDLVID